MQKKENKCYLSKLTVTLEATMGVNGEEQNQVNVNGHMRFHKDHSVNMTEKEHHKDDRMEGIPNYHLEETTSPYVEGRASYCFKAALTLP